jgi:hypothetical protein
MMARDRTPVEEPLVEDSESTEQVEAPAAEIPEFVPEDEFAKPSTIDQEALASHQPEAARPRAVRLRTAPGNPHQHDDRDFPPDTLTPSLPENRKVKDLGPFAGVQPLESDPQLLAQVQDPYNERTPRNQPPMVVVMDSYGNPVLTPA